MTNKNTAEKRELVILSLKKDHAELLYNVLHESTRFIVGEKTPEQKIIEKLMGRISRALGRLNDTTMGQTHAVEAVVQAAQEVINQESGK